MICAACGKETDHYIIDERGRPLGVRCYWNEHQTPEPAICDACGRMVEWTIPYRGGRYGERCYFQVRESEHLEA